MSIRFCVTSNIVIHVIIHLSANRQRVGSDGKVLITQDQIVPIECQGLYPCVYSVLVDPVPIDIAIYEQLSHILRTHDCVVPTECYFVSKATIAMARSLKRVRQSPHTITCPNVGIHSF